MHITALEVPVVYTSVLSLVPGFHARPPGIPQQPDLSAIPKDEYDFVFYVGLGATGEIVIEQQAHKLGYVSADAGGKGGPTISANGQSGKALRGFAEGVGG